MSALEDTVFFLIALQLAITVVNHIEIIPGVYLNTGAFSPFTTYYDPLNDISMALNSTQGTLHSLGSNGSPGHIIFSLNRFLGVVSINPPFTFDVDLNYGIYGIPFTGIIEAIACVVFFGGMTLLNLAISLLGMILTYLINITIGAIPMWIFLFSLIDPILGKTLGIAIGGFQIIVVGWYIRDYISKLIAGVVKDIPV